MSLALDTKEELRLRMTDLQQRLKDSEDERRRLEKTCDILIRAFQEEERMYYQILNNKYEKFVEDCNVRRKRNDIILRSLCNVEDKAKALFAKTQRLKLLKDRYVSYLKQNEFLKTEQTLKHVTPLLPRVITDTVLNKSVHWKTPLAANVDDYNTKDPAVGTEYSDKLGFTPVLSGIPNYTIGPKMAISSSENLYSYPFRNTVNEFKHNSITAHSNVPKESNSDCLQYERFKPQENQVNQNKQSLNGEYADSKNSVFHKYNESKNEERTDLFRFVPEMKKLEELYSEDELSLLQEKIVNRKDMNKHQQSKQDDFESLETENSQNDDGKKLASNSIATDDGCQSINYSGHVDNVKKVDELEYSGSEFVTRLNCAKNNLEEVKALKEEGILKHQELVDKLKMSLEAYKENESKMNGNESEKIKSKKYDFQTEEKGEVKVTENDENFKRKLRTNFTLPSCDIQENNVFSPQKNNGEDVLTEIKEEITYPKGLDGIDFHNETYPESYYEQPVHSHNYTSLASNVILEEDEYESDGDQQDVSEGEIQNPLTKGRPSEGLSKVQNESSSSSADDGSRLLKSLNETKIKTKEVDSTDLISVSQPLVVDTEKFADDQKKSQTDQVEVTSVDENSPHPTKSNLIHLLESDSESFQIEHGQVISGNEDSDFDFSLQQNSDF